MALGNFGFRSVRLVASEFGSNSDERVQARLEAFDRGEALFSEFDRRELAGADLLSGGCDGGNCHCRRLSHFIAAPAETRRVSVIACGSLRAAKDRDSKWRES